MNLWFPPARQSSGPVVPVVSVNGTYMAWHAEDMARTASASWALETADAGYTGIGYLKATASSGDPPNTGFNPDHVISVLLDVSISQSWRMYVRQIAPMTNRNFYYRVESWDRQETWQRRRSATEVWGWYACALAGLIPPGERLVEIHVGSSGWKLDKVVLLKDGDPEPTGLGPPVTT